MVQIGQIVVHLTIQPLSVLLNIWCPVHHTGEKTMVQMGQIVVHITTHPLPVLLIIGAPDNKQDWQRLCCEMYDNLTYLYHSFLPCMVYRGTR